MLAALLGATFGAVAQDDPAIEEVQVFAQKREQALGDVPMAVSTLSGEQLAASGVKDIQGVARQIPALEVQSNLSTTQTNFRIRRVGNLGNIPTFEPAVGVFVDGAYRSRSLYAATELFDIERIEILRGPQTTLYGKNATAGVIGIYTTHPPGEPAWKAELSLGQHDVAGNPAIFGFQGSLGGPVNESLRASLAVAFADHQPIMSQALATGGEDANDLNRYSMRGQLLWEAPGGSTWRLIAGYSNDDSDATTADLFYDPRGFLPIVLGTLQAAGVSTPCSDNDPHNRIGCTLQPVTQDLDTHEFTLIGEYDLDGGWRFTSITSYDGYDSFTVAADVTQVSAPLARFQDTQEGNSWQQELRLTSPENVEVEWLAGVFWHSNTFWRGDRGRTPTFAFDIYSDHPVVSALNQQLLGTPFPVPIAVQGQNGYLDSAQESDYVAGYGQLTWKATESLAVTASLRAQLEGKDAHIRQWTDLPHPSIFSLNTSPAAVSGDGLSHDLHATSWSVSPQWHVTDETMLFLTASRSYKSGGFNTGFGTIPITDRDFDDEQIDHVEGGVKSTLRSGRMYLAASIFATDYEDYQDAAFIGLQFTVGNAEKAELRGAEFEGRWQLGRSLAAEFAVSYADFAYARHTSGACNPGRAPDSPTTPGACVLDGERPVNAPKWKTYLGLNYDRTVARGDLYVRGAWSWTDQYNTSFSADPRLAQGAYSWISLRAGVRRGRCEVVAWVENLLDETVVNFDSVLSLYAGDGSFQSFLQPPRSYGLTLRVEY